MGQAERGATAERHADRGAQDLAGEPMERRSGGRPPVVTDVGRLSGGGKPAQRLVLADDERLALVDGDGGRRRVVQIDDVQRPRPGIPWYGGGRLVLVHDADEEIRGVARRGGGARVAEVEDDPAEELAQAGVEGGQVLGNVVRDRPDAQHGYGEPDVLEVPLHGVDRRAGELRERRRAPPAGGPAAFQLHEHHLVAGELLQQAGERSRDQRLALEAGGAGDADRGRRLGDHLTPGHLRQPLAEHPGKGLEHLRVVQEELLEDRLVHGQQTRVAGGRHRGRPLAPEQQRHLAEELSRTEPVDDPPRRTSPDLQLAADADEEGVPLVALGADRVAAAVGHVDEPPGQRFELVTVEGAEQRDLGENLDAPGDR